MEILGSEKSMLISTRFPSVLGMLIYTYNGSYILDL